MFLMEYQKSSLVYPGYFLTYQRFLIAYHDIFTAVIFTGKDILSWVIMHVYMKHTCSMSTQKYISQPAVWTLSLICAQTHTEALQAAA